MVVSLENLQLKSPNIQESLNNNAKIVPDNNALAANSPENAGNDQSLENILKG